MCHVRKYIHGPAARTKKLTVGDCTSVQGQILHTAPYRDVISGFTQFSDEEALRIGS